ncbi:MAG: glycosyltransferase family 2 protein [Armatimonadota bacterium]
MLKPPLVSVVIPMFNSQHVVQRAINSILKQSVQDFEIIVVDDGSSDNGPYVVRHIADPRIKLLSQANSGPGIARNHGLELAIGEFIAFLDTDDEWLPDFLEVTLDFLYKHSSCAAVFTSYELILDTDSSPNHKSNIRTLDTGVYQLTKSSSMGLANALLAFMCTVNFLARKKDIKDLNGFYAKPGCTYGEDRYLHLKLLFSRSIGIISKSHVIVHGEASMLSRSIECNRPVEAVLLDASGVEAACKPELSSLLDKVIERRAIHYARYYARNGRPPDPATARRLLITHPATGDNCLPRLNAWYWICISPIISPLRKIKHAARATCAQVRNKIRKHS